MKRSLFGLAAALCIASAMAAAPLTDDQRAAAVEYVNRLQNEDGGYRLTAASGPSQLDPTVNVLRALRYLEADPKNLRHLRLFILSCIDPETGGFSDLPGGAPDARSTARGLQALHEVGQGKHQRARRAVEYLLKNAKTLPDRYIALAAMEAAGYPHPDPSSWRSTWEAVRNPDGTYGRSVSDTAGAVIALTRLGSTAADRAAVVKALQAAQRPDGGFPGPEGNSDLAATYRVMRAFILLKEKPDLSRVTDFTRRSRNEDGGFGPLPGAPSTPANTYHAAITLKWIEEMEKP